MHFNITLFVFFVTLLLIYLTKSVSIKLKWCYITALFYTIAMNMLFQEFSSKKSFSYNCNIDVG